MEQKYWVPALERATNILNLIAEQQGQLRLMELSKKSAINKSTLFSLLNTMCCLGWVFKNTDETYSLGKVIGLFGASYLNQFDILKFFNLEAQSAVAKINETIQLSVLEGREIIYLGKRDANKPFVLASYPGMRLPAYCTAMGKVHLSGLSYEELKNLYPELKLTPLTPYTVKNIEGLWRQIDEFRKNGYAVESQEAVIGYACIAVPVYNHQKKIIAAISATFPENTRNSIQKNVLNTICDLGHRLSRHAGFDGA